MAAQGALIIFLVIVWIYDRWIGSSGAMASRRGLRPAG
jgi:uncharacterized membrane protein